MKRTIIAIAATFYVVVGGLYLRLWFFPTMGETFSGSWIDKIHFYRSLLFWGTVGLGAFCGALFLTKGKKTKSE